MRQHMSSIIGKATASYWFLLVWRYVRHHDALWASHLYDLPIDWIWILMERYQQQLAMAEEDDKASLDKASFISTWFVYYHAFCGKNHSSNRSSIL